MRSFLQWVDHRTGIKGLLHATLYENVPGGSRWRYVWGSTLTFGLLVQFITGIFLWMAYSPSSHSAWESVNYIQHEMVGGWFLRGLHHYTAQVMTVLLVLHLMQVVIDGAYQAPREVNYWFGLFLLLLVLGLSLTGYLLPWDQKGYWATKVATNLMAIAPVFGESLQRLVVGGTDYGHHTLTRFFALHAGVLPALTILLVIGHIYLFRRHGIKAKEPRMGPDCAFCPDQVLKDVVACLAVMATVLFLILRPRFFGLEAGADLGPPADPSEPFSAARPEWYFLFLFQFLKYFPGETEIWGAIIIPTLILVVLFLMPFIGKWRLGHRFNIGFLFALLMGAGLLTYLARYEDSRHTEYQLAVKNTERESERVKELARLQGIQFEGAVQLLRNDPYVQGPRIFSRNCASCHRYNGHDGLGQVPTEPASAADLAGFASRDWIAGLLSPDKISTSHYFGGTKFSDGKMARFVKKEVAGYGAVEKEHLRKGIIALSAEAHLPSQRSLDEVEAGLIAEGKEKLTNELGCTDCHQFHKVDEDASGPDLTGYGSREWLLGLIRNPAHSRFYGKRNDRMPAYGEEKILDAKAMELVVDWLRGEWPLPPAP